MDDGSRHGAGLHLSTYSFSNEDVDILILLIMPITDLSKLRGVQFRPFSKIIFYIFVANFLVLMQLGAKHVESPFIEFGQISTILYFSHFLIIVPLISLIENILIELILRKK